MSRSLPSHIAAVVEKVKVCPPRALPELPNYPYMQPSGLEPCLLKPDSGASRTATLMIAQVKSSPKVENIELVKEDVTEPANVNYLHVGGKKKLKASYDTYVTELLVRSCPAPCPNLS